MGREEPAFWQLYAGPCAAMWLGLPPSSSLLPSACPKWLLALQYDASVPALVDDDGSRQGGLPLS